MRLEQLKYITEIAKYNSMSTAAENLRIAQPSLSFAIRQLEEELDIKIFSRSKSGSFLTEQGLVIYQKANQVLDIIDSMYPSSSNKQILSGTINILSVAVFSSTIAKISADFFN